MRLILKESQSVGICNETTNNTFCGFMSATGVLRAENFIKIDYRCYELKRLKMVKIAIFHHFCAYNSNESKDSYIFRCLLLLSVLTDFDKTFSIYINLRNVLFKFSLRGQIEKFKKRSLPVSSRF